MGVLIRWEPPASESDWDKAEVHRANSENGSYTKIQTQNISDNTYYDIDGDGTKWYKIRFKVSSSGTTSDFSDPIQGSSVNAYCSIEDVRRMTGLDNSEIDDKKIFDLLEFATGQLNADVNLVIEEELVEYISAEKQNTIDGSNTTFYVKNPWIGDLDNNGQITVDDLDVWVIDKDNNRSDKTVSSIDDTQTGKFTLSSAPASTDDLYVRYAHAPLDEKTPHALIRTACAMLAGAYAFTNIEAKRINDFNIGRVRIREQSSGFDKLFARYERIRDQINANLSNTVEFPSEIQELEKLMR